MRHTDTSPDRNFAYHLFIYFYTGNKYLRDVWYLSSYFLLPNETDNCCLFHKVLNVTKWYILYTMRYYIRTKFLLFLFLIYLYYITFIYLPLLKNYQFFFFFLSQRNTPLSLLYRLFCYLKHFPLVYKMCWNEVLILTMGHLFFQKHFTLNNSFKKYGVRHGCPTF